MTKLEAEIRLDAAYGELRADIRILFDKIDVDARVAGLEVR